MGGSYCRPIPPPIQVKCLYCYILPRPVQQIKVGNHQSTHIDQKLNTNYEELENCESWPAGMPEKGRRDSVRSIFRVQNNSQPSVNFRAFIKIDCSFPQVVGHYVLTCTWSSSTSSYTMQQLCTLAACHANKPQRYKGRQLSSVCDTLIDVVR